MGVSLSICYCTLSPFCIHLCNSSFVFDFALHRLAPLGLRLLIPSSTSTTMRSPLPSTALIVFAFLCVANARRGLDADELHLLTRGTDYTFHSICADFKNPDLFFDEWVFCLPLFSSCFGLILFAFFLFLLLLCFRGWISRFGVTCWYIIASVL